MASAVGILAGEGILPVLVARGARAAGHKVVVCAFRGSAWPELEAECDQFHWVTVARPGGWIRHFTAGGCEQIVMIGRVSKAPLHDPWRYFRNIPDLTGLKLWLSVIRRDMRAQTILQALIRLLAKHNLSVMDSTRFIADHLATLGTLTHRSPNREQAEDIEYGWKVCQALRSMDIGQAVAVLNHDVIAVEGIEGTDAMIERAGKLCPRGGWVLVKAGNALADMRADVPAIGTTTIEHARAAKCGAIVVEADRVLIVEKTKSLELADRYRIPVVGRAPSPVALAADPDLNPRPKA